MRMHVRSILPLVLSLMATAVSAADGRIRIENTGTSGRLEVVLSDESVQTVTISVPGVVAGETMTVEAPAPVVRLGGGSIDGDPLLEAMVLEKVRLSSQPRKTVSVLPAPPRHRPVQQRALNQVFTNAGFALEPAWYGSYVPAGSYRTVVSRVQEHRTQARTRARPSSSSRPARSTSTARAMMPRR